ncbi:MAG: citrate synthase [Polyangiaceae bacterium]
MQMQEQRVAAADSGLAGVTVAETWLSEVDGERGRVIVAGHALEEVAAFGFEGAAGLLWDGALPGEGRREALRRALGSGREAAFAAVGELRGALAGLPPMAALRAGVAAMPSLEEPAALLGRVAVFAAAAGRLAEGEEPLPPDPALGHAEDYLRMLRGDAPSSAEARAIDTYFATVSEHGFNASTFAARVVASTEASGVAALVAGIAALEGRLHGGAPGPVLDMLDAVEARGDAAAWLREELDAGRRIMGMGHRVYRVRDPRAAILAGALTALDPGAGRLALAREVEAEAEALLRERHPDRPLRANVEFYTALLLEALRVPRASFTTTFAVARAAGWWAHVEEQRRRGRLLRPRARYVGPRP